MFRSILRYSPIRSTSGLALFTLVFSGIGYGGIYWNHNRKYDHPIVQEAVRLLQQNEQIVKLAGYPLNLKVKLKSEAKVSDSACQFTFQVVGPKGTANIELVGESRELEDIPDPNQFYIPSIETILDVLRCGRDQSKLESTEVDKKTRFWKIDQLAADIGLQGDFRIVVIDGNKVLNKSQSVTKLVTARKTLSDIKQEIDARKPATPQTEQEMEEARRYRQQEVYRKVGSIRIMTFFIAILGGMAVYNYVKQHRRISVLNTQIHQQSLHFVQSNMKVKKIFGNHIKFNNQLRGGQVGNQAEFETDIYGSKLGVVYVQGMKDETTNDWKINSIMIAEKDIEGQIKEKIKIW